jgi:hypothetical protein
MCCGFVETTGKINWRKWFSLWAPLLLVSIGECWNHCICQYTFELMSISFLHEEELWSYLNYTFCLDVFFMVAFCTTLTKLHPKMRPYEYGFRVFLLTFYWYQRTSLALKSPWKVRHSTPQHSVLGAQDRIVWHLPYLSYYMLLQKLSNICGIICAWQCFLFSF